MSLSFISLYPSCLLISLSFLSPYIPLTYLLLSLSLISSYPSHLSPHIPLTYLLISLSIVSLFPSYLSPLISRSLCVFIMIVCVSLCREMSEWRVRQLQSGEGLHNPNPLARGSRGHAAGCWTDERSGRDECSRRVLEHCANLGHGDKALHCDIEI